MVLLGEYDVTLDAKGRYLLPGGLKKQLPEGQAEKFVVNRGFETCLTIYTLQAWETLSQHINKLNDFSPKVRDFKRMFLNGATIVELDSANRMLLPKNLASYASLTKDIVLCAQGNKIEIWDKELYSKYINNNAQNFSDLANEVMGDSFINPFDK